MKATDFEHGYDPAAGEAVDRLAEWLEGDEGQAAIARLDGAWEAVMKQAEKAGFIVDAYGGAARICTNRAYMEANGARALADRMRMCGVEFD